MLVSPLASVNITTSGCNNSGVAMHRDRIMELVWGVDFEGESRTLDMHIKTLRQKLGSAGAMIKTVRNVGYVLEP